MSATIRYSAIEFFVPFEVMDITKLPEKPAVIISLLIVLVCVCLQVLPHDVQQVLRYDRVAVMDVELWRLLSGHLVHLSWNHLVLNIAGLVLLSLLFETAWQAKDIVLGGLFSALLISLGIYLLFPGIGWYVGLSGVLHGWFAIACIRLWSGQPRFARLLIMGLIAKLVFENVATTVTDSDWLGGEVIEQAHWLGASSGLLYALLCKVIVERLPKHT